MWKSMINALGPTTNLLVLYFVDRYGEISRDEIRSLITLYKSEFAEERMRSKIKDGKESVTFWTQEHERNGMLRRVKNNPVTYTMGPKSENILKKKARTYGPAASAA
jgi:hypothetical protein